MSGEVCFRPMNRLVVTACLAFLACGAPARSPELPTATIPEVQTSVDTAAAITAYQAALGKLEADPRIPADDKRTRREHAEHQLAILRARTGAH
jgi:hypothetical protein